MVLRVKNEIDKHKWHSFKQKMTVIQELKTLMRITHNLIEGGSMGRLVRLSDLQSSGGHRFEFHFSHYLDLFHSSKIKSSPKLVNTLANWFAFGQLRFLINVMFNLNHLFQFFAQPHLTSVL